MPLLPNLHHLTYPNPILILSRNAIYSWRFSSLLFLHCWWDCKLAQPLWKSVWRFLRKLDIVLPEDPAIPLLGIYPEDVSTGKKDTCSTMFIAAGFEVFDIEIFHLLGKSYTTIFYIICGHCEGCCFLNFFLSLFIICIKEGY